MTDNDIIFSEIPGVDGNIGLITLNRPQVLNALNHTMFLALSQQLTLWADDQTIKAVVIQAVPGRAFCAGGDIRLAYQKGLTKDDTLTAFFDDEYSMNLQVYHFPKPYLAFLDGITMGGGAGISINGSVRIATANMVFAMPETGIGFYPDVGASYFLSRLPNKIGFYLGLTGAKISFQDCAAVQLIDYIIPSEDIEKILQHLAETPLDQHSEAVIADIMNQYSKAYTVSELMDHAHAIEMCFSHNTIEKICHALENYPDAWCQSVALELAKKSPTSLKVTLKQLQRGTRLSFDECIAMERRLTQKFMQQADFFEGVRAAIIDKDQNPRWQPQTLDAVTDREVESYFE